MKSMPTKFSVSTNIIRDSGRENKYVLTPNAKNTIESVIDNYNTGIHSFVIIGSYGTGKSTLLWALEQTLTGREVYFDVSKLPIKKNKVKFIRFVGEYQSIIDSFAEQLSVKNSLAGNQKIFDAIYQQYDEVKKDGLLLIYIDELGKFLEYAAKHNSEKELYFIQQLAEFVNHPDRNIMLITTLHQNIEAYAFGLNERQRNEWVKVKGRLTEVTFNEPIEQLLLLASEYIDASPGKSSLIKEIDNINKLSVTYNIFQAKDNFIKRVGAKLFPLDFISGYTLTYALQKYGQNERSLFTFLESREFKAVQKDNNETLFFNLVWLYDYLWVNYYSLLNSKANPHFNAWADIKSSIERVEAVITNNVEEAIHLVKVIGLLNIL